MQKLTYCLGISQTFAPVYHPQANPVGRKTRDLKTQLSIYVGKEHDTWDSRLAAIRFAMNTAKCDSTGYSAAYLTFGRELRSPLEAHHDLKAIIESENFISQITPHLIKMSDTLEKAKEATEKKQDRNKLYGDLKRRPQISFDIGDKVLVRTHVLSNANNNVTSKFIPRRDGPYIVIERKGITYTVASEENPETNISNQSNENSSERTTTNMQNEYNRKLRSSRGKLIWKSQPHHRDD
ncbi:uncharacterized protein LOC142235487 [Haematobia irritans]|uniref:uncharacterized protein LOC142235487 n=1 Tax=Haematobia irritans TaxID=7368 RepID=UPI003F4FC097